MNNLHGLIAVLILAVINAKSAVTENEYYPGKWFELSDCEICVTSDVTGSVFVCAPLNFFHSRALYV